MAVETSMVPANGTMALSAAAARLVFKDRSGRPYDPVQMELLLALCGKHGLVPELKHLVLISDQVYVTNAGLLHVAHQHGDLDGIETRPATPEERAAYLGDDADTKTRVWRCDVWRRGQSRPYTGWGKAASTEPGAAKTHPQEMAACVPLSSRILTKTGWSYHDELKVGEEVLAYDVANDRCVWTPLLDVSAFGSSPMARLYNKSGRFDFLCTPDHKWATVRPPRDDRPRAIRKLREARQLSHDDTLVLSAPAPSGDSAVTPEQAAIIGWLFTDGSVLYGNDRVEGSAYGMGERGTGVRPTGWIQAVVNQSKPAAVERIRDLVGAVATESVTPSYERLFPSGNVSTCLPAHRWHLPSAYARDLFTVAGIATDADLPALALRLTSDARKAMLAAFMDADGTERGTFGKKRRPGTMEAFRMLATLEGIGLGKPRLRENGIPYQNLKRRTTVSASELTLTPIEDQPCWCPTTAYGTWVMRQGDRVTITGNTRSTNRALRLAFNIGLTSLEEVGDDAPPARAVDQQTGEIRQAPPRAMAAPRQQQPATAPTPAPAEATLTPRQAANISGQVVKLATDQGFEETDALRWLAFRVRALGKGNLEELTVSEGVAVHKAAASADFGPAPVPTPDDDGEEEI